MGAHLVQRVREHRERLVQLPAHTEPLAALTGEQHPKAPLGHNSRDHTSTVGDHGLKAGQEVLPLPAEHHGPVLMRRAAGQQRPAHIDGLQLGAPVHVLAQPVGLRPQRLRTPRRHQPRQRTG
nr:hypothetical protein [Streptomyces aurantiacus]